MNHVYDDDRDSPYIVTIDLTGTGAAGIGEGSDSLEVSVSHVPTIEVFAGEDRTVGEGDKVDYSASFIRPGDLWDYQYQWDFGDGSPTVTGKPEDGTTRVETTHAFSDHRPAAYTPVLTVSAMSDAGRVSGSGSFSVRVTESEGFRGLGRRRDGQDGGAGVVCGGMGGDDGNHLARHLEPGDTGGRWDCLPRKSPCPPLGSPTAGTRVLHQVWWKVG